MEPADGQETCRSRKSDDVAGGQSSALSCRSRGCCCQHGKVCRRPKRRRCCSLGRRGSVVQAVEGDVVGDAADVVRVERKRQYAAQVTLLLPRAVRFSGGQLALADRGGAAVGVGDRQHPDAGAGLGDRGHPAAGVADDTLDVAGGGEFMTGVLGSDIRSGQGQGAVAAPVNAMLPVLVKFRTLAAVAGIEESMVPPFWVSVKRRSVLPHGARVILQRGTSRTRLAAVLLEAPRLLAKAPGVRLPAMLRTTPPVRVVGPV